MLLQDFNVAIRQHNTTRARKTDRRTQLRRRRRNTATAITISTAITTIEALRRLLFVLCVKVERDRGHRAARGAIHMHQHAHLRPPLSGRHWLLFAIVRLCRGRRHRVLPGFFIRLCHGCRHGAIVWVEPRMRACERQR